MDTSALKKFAQEARRQLLEQVAARMEQVLQVDSIEVREKAAAVAQLREQIAESSKEAVIDSVAYTWFNRFCALRYMDVNHYTRMGIVSPQDGYTQPEILAEAKQGIIDESFIVDQAQVIGLLNGQIPSANPQGEAYRLLLVGACRAYHAQMPFLFPEIEDYTALLMPEDLLSENSMLQGVREALTPDACQDVEVIGWLYQYYISERKDEVFAALKKRKKIEAEDIPAATQLFTPHWIVRYLVENSLGRLWMLNNRESKLVEQMEYYIQPEEPETDFLQVDSPEELKLCDPACGSGHMLTYAFDLLYAIYEEQGYDPVQIPQLILGKNLFGIEIDSRAGHLAAFALMMKAREKDRRFFSRGAEPNICVLENVSFDASEIDDYMQAVGRDLFTQDLWLTLRQFEQVENFGSLIRPALKNVGFVRERLEKQGVLENLFLHNTNQKVEHVLEMAEYLSPRYHVVVANPPYMGNRNLNLELKEFLNNDYKDVKSDTFSAFIIRNLELAQAKGQLGFMSPFVWMFISSFEKLRTYLIDNKTITSLIQLEYSGFEGATVPICAFTLDNSHKPDFKGGYVRLADFRGAANQALKTLEAIQNLDCGWFFRSSSYDFKKIPGAPIAYWVSDKVREVFDDEMVLEELAKPRVGLQTGNNARFLRLWYEVAQQNVGYNFQSREEADISGLKWFPYNKGGNFRKWYGNNEYLVNWEKDGKEIQQFRPRSVIRNPKFYFKPSITWTDISSSFFGARYSDKGAIFDVSGSSVFPRSEDIHWLTGFFCSKISTLFLKILNPTLHFQVGNIASLPIIEPDKARAKEIGEDAIFFARQDWDAYEISWGFKTLPLVSPEYRNRMLVKSYNKLRLYWESNTLEAKRLEEKNNRIFIEAYGLQGELTPEVALSEITLTCNSHYRYPDTRRKTYTNEEREALLVADTIKEFISYAVGCMFGRYSLDKPGLILANQGEGIDDFRLKIGEVGLDLDDLQFVPDYDNAIPLLDEGWFDDDIVDRFKHFLRVTFGDEHYEENLAFLENAIGKDIRSYFLKDFYREHVKMYKKRPIYWLFSSPKSSFNALIYMHRYRPDTVSIILNDYLREYREKISAHKTHLQAIERDPNASQGEKTKALREIDKIDKVLAELREYEDEILYPLAAQQIQIDLDDGVKVNYPKFGKALKRVSGLSG